MSDVQVVQSTKIQDLLPEGLTSHQNPLKSVGIDYQILIWLVVAHLLAIAAIPFFSWTNFWVMIAMEFVAQCLGITFCYHRMLSHRAFKVPKFFEWIFATCGVIALQGSPLEWVAHHRMHHAYSDREKDPHNSRLGFWHSHMGWLFTIVPAFDDPSMLNRFARDIARDPYYRWLEKMWPQALIQIVLGLIFLAIGGWGLVLWGIFFRLIVGYHTTWLVNSAAHFWGYRTYSDVKDNSRNNWVVALLTWGEGWHNNHHKYQNLAAAGHKWWEIDITMGIIRLLQFCGIAYDVRDQIPHDSSSAAARAESPTSLARPALGTTSLTMSN